MGAAGSSSRAPEPSSPSTEPGEERFVYATDGSWSPEYTNENIRQRTRTSVFDVGEEPRSQGTSPYATTRDEESRSQRPTAPSLSNLRPARPNTLLTCAAQMTGWQTAEVHGPSFSHRHQEAMELSKVISQLAMANHQLASAHTATLAHLEALYVELRNEKEFRRRSTSTETLDEALKHRLTTEQNGSAVCVEEGRRTEVGFDRLEDQSDVRQGGQRNRPQEEDRKPRSRTERLETTTESRVPDGDDERQRFINICDPVRNQINGVACNNRLPCDDDVPERECKTQTSMDEEAVAGSNSRISVAHDGEQTGVPRCEDGTDCSVTNLHLEKSDQGDCGVVGEERGSDGKEVTRLTEEVERLNAEQLEHRCANARLAKELAEEKSSLAKLRKDYGESKVRREEMESDFQVHRVEYDKLMAKFELATKETESLVKGIDLFNAQRDAAEARISILEQDLQKSLEQNEQIKSIGGQEVNKLKEQLLEEVSDKKKQTKALEDALDEIQRLKETTKTEKSGNDDDGSKGDAGPTDSTDDTQECQAADRGPNIEEFKKELTLKREARQRAIAAVSSEMERLRRELDAEKEAHSETSRELDLLRSAQNDSQSQAQANTTDEGTMRSKIEDEKSEEREIAMERMEAQRLSSILKVSDELRNDIRIQIDKVDDLRYQLETEPDQHRYRIRFLSDLTNRMRETVYTRERRASDLKDHLAQILEHFGDKSFLEGKNDVAEECERQLGNINSLKGLYNERLKVLSELKEAAVKELADTKTRLEHTLKKCECLEEDLKKADEKIDVQDTEISNLESQLGLTKADCRDLQNQMSLINGLFTQMLLGATSADMDLDRLTQLLQENHDLICDMAREEGTEAAALPKLLLDLIEQVEGSKGSEKRVDGENSAEGESEKKEDDLQQEDIAHNLPKVWRVLLELLSCHAEGTPSASASSSSDPNICYKSVDTPAGPRLVISVSKTYIRLKELILEKKHLEKEMNRMKQLNTHLESKLGEQEKRLSTVSVELSKTWTIVDRMQAQHQQLHTHEKILRYELQQKRKMLQELKQELEYCREKWESARQKNTNTELEWRSLRREFAARKALAVHDSCNNSGESGFSDERGDDTDDEDNAVEDRIRLGPRRKPRKESPRTPTPDTESEQPTDTELSESKTGSPGTLEERTPTPETEAEMDETEVTGSIVNTGSTNAVDTLILPEGPQEALNPLDRALTNVIENLINIDDNITSTSESFLISNNENASKSPTREGSIPRVSGVTECNIQPWNTSEEAALITSETIEDDTEENTAIATSGQACQETFTVDDFPNATNTDGEQAKNEELPRLSVPHVPIVTSATVAQSVFSIGPFPASNAPPSVVKNVQFSDPLIVGPSNRFSAPVFGASLPGEQFAPSAVSSTDRDVVSAENCGSRSIVSTNELENVSAESELSLDAVQESSAAKSTPVGSPGDTDTQEGSSDGVGSARTEEKKVARKNRTPEEALAAREDRLKRLEEQAKWLMNKMNATSSRGSALSTRLEELHGVYGEPPVPPPMPDVLPSRRLGTNLSDLPRQVPESSTTEGAKNIEKPVSSEDSNESPSNNAP